MDNEMATFILEMPDGREYISQIPLAHSGIILRAADLLGMGDWDDDDLDYDEMTAEEFLYEVVLEETVIHTVYVHGTSESDARYRAIDMVESETGSFDSIFSGDLRATAIKELEVDDSVIH